jgi:C1A family cysteine protease
MASFRSRLAFDATRWCHFSSPALAVIVALVLSGCGGGGGGGESTGPTPGPVATPPPETLFVPANATTTPTPAGAEMITPEEFRRRHVEGKLQVMTPAAQQEQLTARQRSIEAERDFLESQTDLSAEVTALLAESRASADLEGRPMATLLDGQNVALIELGSRIEKAAQDYRLARDPLNALASYELSYSLLSEELKAQVPAPDTLRAGTLEQIRQAARQIDAALATLVNLDNARLDPDAPLPPSEMNVARMAKTAVAGNGADNSGTCTSTGLVRRYWFPLRGFVAPVKDQGERGTCWAFAAVGAVESRERVQNNNPANLSEQFLVNKYKHEWFPTDFVDGGSAAAALNGAVARNQALQSEAGWTYNPARGRPADAFASGVTGTSASYIGACLLNDNDEYKGSCSETAHQSHISCTRAFELNFCGFDQMEFSGPGVAASQVRLIWSNGETFNLNQYRALLSSGVSLMASFPVYEGFRTAPRTAPGAGIVSDYRTQMRDADNNLVNGDYGGHLVQIVGFISNEEMSFPGAPASAVGGGGYFVIRNSWGCGAGDGGYFYVPADYVSSLFSTLEVLDFDARRSAAWDSEQITPGGTSGLAIDPRGTTGVDLRVQENLADKFVVSHPVANYVRLTVTSDRDGLLYDGQWLVNAPAGGSLFANSLPVNLQTEGLRTLTITARYGTQLVSVTKTVLVLNSPPTIIFESFSVPQQNENYLINAIVTDRNEVNPGAICAAMTWSVNAPDTIVSGTGCDRVIRFGATGGREVRASSQDREGRAGSVISTFTVLAPPLNPYPRISTFGIYSRDFQRIENVIVGCQSNPVANNVVIDVRQLGCVPQGVNVPERARYFSQITVENPAAEVLSYDWTYTDHYPNPIVAPRILVARTATPSYDINGFAFISVDVPTVSTHLCTIDVRVNAPEASRSRSLRVWSGQCINLDVAPR